jgi:ubiquinone/menaquinone biosynthesis C-methylase UbiE
MFRMYGEHFSGSSLTWVFDCLSSTKGFVVMNLNEVQRAAQEQFARQSDRYGKGHILENVDDVRAALTQIALPPRGRVLDVATGGGHTGLLLAELGHDVTLSDITRAMLEGASHAARERGLSVRTELHSAEQFPYADASFDLVTCRVAAHHFSSPEAFVRESARVLKAGGWLLVIDGTVEDDQTEAEEWSHTIEKLRDPSHHRFVTPRTWRSFCEAAGLKVTHSGLTPFKQPDLNWYFETAATSRENRRAVLDLVRTAPESACRLFRLGEEDGKIVWWWQRLTLIARKR